MSFVFIRAMFRFAFGLLGLVLLPILGGIAAGIEASWSMYRDTPEILRFEIEQLKRKWRGEI